MCSRLWFRDTSFRPCPRQIGAATLVLEAKLSSRAIFAENAFTERASPNMFGHSLNPAPRPTAAGADLDNKGSPMSAFDPISHLVILGGVA
jgi:hypothetical protein